MTKRESMQASARKLAKTALRDTMNQNIDDETLREVADRIFKSLPSAVRRAA